MIHKKNFYQLFLCIWLLTACCLLPIFSNAQTQLDSLQKLLANHTSEDEEQFQLLLAVTEAQEFTILKASVITCDKALALAQKLNNQKYIAAALNEKARLLIRSSKSDEALILKEKAFAINEKLNDRNGMADNYLTESIVNLVSGKYDKQKECLDKSLSLLTADVSLTLKGRLYYNICWYYQYTNPDTAFIFINKSLAFILQTDRKYWLSTIYNKMGGLNSTKGDVSKALEYFNKALEISIHEKYFSTASATYENVGWVYSDRANYSLAIDNFIKALKMYEILGDERMQAYELNNIGMTFSNINNFEKALECFNRQIPLSIKINDGYSLSSAYQEVGNVRLKEGKYKEALEWYQKAMKLSFSIL